jgi:hypothetical protein
MQQFLNYRQLEQIFSFSLCRPRLLGLIAERLRLSLETSLRKLQRARPQSNPVARLLALSRFITNYG